MHIESITVREERRRIGHCLTSRSLAESVLPALRALDYELDEIPRGEEGSAYLPDDHPSLWLVDSDLLYDIPEPDAAPNLRLLVFKSPLQPESIDPRVFAESIRPGGLSTVYGLIQAALESTPRSCPRVSTRLSARCIRNERQSVGSLVTLSEGGCLLHTSERIDPGSAVDLEFALPEVGWVSTRAQCRHSKTDAAGLVFSDLSLDLRETIGHFVTRQLSRLGSATLGAPVLQSA